MLGRYIWPQMIKALRTLFDHVVRHGLLLGIRVVWLKSRWPRGTATISSPLTGGAVVVRVGTTDMAIYDQIILQPYLPRDRAFRTIIDCGSNIGLTVRYLNAAYPDARIIAVEPDEGNFELLSRNAVGRPGIECVKAAVWHEPGRLNLKREGLNPSGFQVASAQLGDTEAVTIPQLMARHGIERLSLLKIDIEGSELEVFTAPDLSWLDRVDAISIELHDSWRPGCGDAFFKAIALWNWTFSFHGGAVLCEKR